MWIYPMDKLGTFNFMFMDAKKSIGDLKKAVGI